jgi:glycosyltransferase involved in cell wall biosynthesis
VKDGCGALSSAASPKPLAMRILLHDYPGHAFILELGRKLAAGGNDVLHVYSSSNVSPRGDTESGGSGAGSFATVGLSLGGQIRKDTLVKRRSQEIAHGRLVCAEIQKFRPEVVVCSNTPLDALKLIYATTQDVGAKHVFWCQDIIGLATKSIVGAKLPVIGNIVGDYYINLEANLLRKSDTVIVISEDFERVFETMKVSHPKIRLLPNWAPLEQLPEMPRKNAWSKKQGLDDSFVFLYSGTLGFKHNPKLLLRLAESFADKKEVVVQVVSSGKAADWLAEQAAEKKLPGLRVLPFQPFSDVPSVFGSADVLLTILEPSASEFSVPSKVLAYLCARRPLLLSVPRANLIARTVESVGAGLVVPPDDEDGFIQAAHKLYENPELRAAQGDAARAYAERTFDLDSVSETFLGYIKG